MPQGGKNELFGGGGLSLSVSPSFSSLFFASSPPLTSNRALSARHPLTIVVAVIRKTHELNQSANTAAARASPELAPPSAAATAPAAPPLAPSLSPKKKYDLPIRPPAAVSPKANAKPKAQ